MGSRHYQGLGRSRSAWVAPVSTSGISGCVQDSQNMTLPRLALALSVAIALGCHGSAHPSHSTPPQVAKGFPATRWVPANPTYVLASPTVRDAQRSVKDIIDSIGVIGGVDAAEVARDLGRLIAIDPLNPDALTAMGIDLEGGIVMFSEDVAPTFVVQIAAPDAVQAFFDRQRERGLVTQSVVVEGTELFTAQLPGGAQVKVSWAVAADWLWVHFSLPFAHDDGPTWFTSSHRPEGPAWAKAWQWASTAVTAAKPALIGFVDAHDVIASIVGKMPDALACAKLLEPVRRVGIAVEGGPKRASGKLTIDIGPAAASVASAILPGPPGFAGLAETAPLAVQWNVDLLAVRAWLQPCLKAMNQDTSVLDRSGVRSVRAVLRSLDPADKSATGAVSLDLAQKRYFDALLDEVPLRSTLERSRTYGAYKGHSLTVPFVATLDYVLTDQLGLAGIGDGLLMQMLGAGGMRKGPIAAIDIAPPALSPEAWHMLLTSIGIRRVDDVVAQLVRWRDGHFAVTIEGTSLVVTAAGNRR